MNIFKNASLEKYEDISLGWSSRSRIDIEDEVNWHVILHFGKYRQIPFQGSCTNVIFSLAIYERSVSLYSSCIRYLGCCNKVPQLGWLMWYKCLASQPRRVEVWDQRWQGWFCLMAMTDSLFQTPLPAPVTWDMPWLVDSCLLPVFSPLHVSLPTFPLFIRMPFPLD